MIRPLFVIAFGAFAFAAVADLREPPLDEAVRAGIAEACTYYQARAAAARQTRPGEFVVFLADTCSAAEALLEAGTAEQRQRSAVLLWRISELRRTVAQMDRARALRRAERGFDGLPSHLPVSPSGEFLIAHRMGVMTAFDLWLETGVQFSIAAYP
ncbi:MAG TPA: hypothetical protein VMM59_12035 [Thermohalobaculum sp.]|nr:hypothetical protein [Thermohalobaculum sp.]